MLNTGREITRRTLLRGIGAATLTLPFLDSAIAQGSAPELWFWLYAYPGSDADVSALESRIDEALSYGYTGVALWSSAFTFMGSSVHPANNVAYMQQVIAHARSKGMKTMGTTTPYGYSDDALINNPNWAEGEHITGSGFTVNASKTALIPVNSFGGIVNPGFESGMTGWFSFNDPNMGVDTTVSHSGAASGYITNTGFNARFRQTLNLIPWRQYHVSVWCKTANFQGYSQIEVWDSTTGVLYFNTPLNMQSTQDWTLVEFAFNSRAATQPTLLFGVWGGCLGSMWFDDARVEETALVYVLRRSGTPLKVYDPGNPNTVYLEDADFNAISNPQIASGALSPFSGFYNDPATVTLPATTSLQPGQTVAIDYYALQPAQQSGDVGMCLTEPGAQNWLQQNLQAIANNTPPGMSLLLSYDEMRHMNSCASCKAQNMTAGQLLAWHVANTASLCRSIAPSSALYVWNDMFDPFANAVDNYYFVEGNIAGSWAGLPAGVTILNWNVQNLTNSLRWFSGLTSQQPVPYGQIIAGYYDSGNGAAAATLELQQAQGIPGIAGLMYTTWASDYSQLQSFAVAAKSSWASYLASVPSNATVQSLSSPSGSGVYATGTTISITVTFSLAVTVTGVPQIALNSGGTATYSSGSGGFVLTFVYTVAAGETSARLDATSSSALTLNGGAMLGLGTMPAILTLAAPGAAGSLGANANIAVNISSSPVDVSNQVKVTSSGLVYSRATGQYSATITIQNTSTTAIAASILSVLTNLTAGATVVNRTGVVPTGAYAGAPYVSAAGSGPLAPGTSVTIPVKLTYTGTAPLSYVSKTLSGQF
jgi:hypothetical protein